MTEKELRDAVVHLARLAGWSVVWFPKVPVKRPGQSVQWQTPIGGDGKGWLDLVFHRERVLAVELKARQRDEGWTVTPEQQQWMDRWRIAGCRAYVWGISDLDDGTIQRELTEVRRRDPVVYENDPELVVTDDAVIHADQLTFDAR